MGPISTDDDLPSELELDQLIASESDPLSEPEANSNAGDEGNETQEGLARLIDFLNEKKKRGAVRRAAGPRTKIEQALEAYNKVLDGSEDLRGQKIDIKK